MAPLSNVWFQSEAAILAQIDWTAAAGQKRPFIHPRRFMNIQYCAHPHVVLMPLDITQCLRVVTLFPCKQASKGRQVDGPV